MDFSSETSGSNNTLGLKNFDRLNFPPLTQNLTTDVCIIGYIIRTGLTIYKSRMR